MEILGCKISSTWSSCSPRSLQVMLCRCFSGMGYNKYLFINTTATGPLAVHFKLLFQNHWSEAETWDLSHQHPGDSWLSPVPGVSCKCCSLLCQQDLALTSQGHMQSWIMDPWIMKCSLLAVLPPCPLTACAIAMLHGVSLTPGLWGWRKGSWARSPGAVRGLG